MKSSYTHSTSDQTITRLSLLAFSALVGFSSSPIYGAIENHPAGVLNAKYFSLGKTLRNNPFKRALALDSVESSYNLKGDVYAVVDYPIATVQTALQTPTSWCDVLILHLNTKYCKAQSDSKNAGIKMVVGKKTAQ